MTKETDLLHSLEFKLLKFLETLLQQTQLANAQQKRMHFIVLCSGGKDSVALLCGLHKIIQSKAVLRRKEALTMSAIHFNHLTRPEENSNESRLVSTHCLQRGIELTIIRRDAVFEQLLAGAGQGNFQDTARLWRKWHAQKEQQKQKDYSFVCTAHHAADQVETVLLHLLRGSGIKGLLGMQAVEPKQKWLRPFLNVTQMSIIEYLQEKKIAWCEDSSNSHCHYSRNFLRHKVLPMLAEVNPRYEYAVTRLTHNLQAFVSEASKGLFSDSIKYCELREFSGPHFYSRIHLLLNSQNQASHEQNGNLILLLNLLAKLQMDQWENLLHHVKKIINTSQKTSYKITLVSFDKETTAQLEQRLTLNLNATHSPIDKMLLYASVSRHSLKFLIGSSDGVWGAKQHDIVLTTVRFTTSP